MPGKIYYPSGNAVRLSLVGTVFKQIQVPSLSKADGRIPRIDSLPWNYQGKHFLG